MEILIILIITIIVLGFSIVGTVDAIKGFESDSNFSIYSLFLYSLFVFFWLLYYLNKPKAMDVYRGKTTLEITYKDRVPIDSTVVWKNK